MLRAPLVSDLSGFEGVSLKHFTTIIPGLDSVVDENTNILKHGFIWIYIWIHQYKHAIAVWYQL